MASKLALRQYISLPPHPAGDFDHGDVYLESGRVFVACRCEVDTTHHGARGLLEGRQPAWVPPFVLISSPRAQSKEVRPWPSSFVRRSPA